MAVKITKTLQELGLGKIKKGVDKLLAKMMVVELILAEVVVLECGTSTPRKADCDETKTVAKLK
ncbi:hypothetical protein Glove_313g37 [Diversispora epigaea]|uniref:Uncharacterized protein n=1 Tax=Diversispora epigaea TaxID=1348612 RepID=A0A397HQZ2_9GLOM|nr:hypothetical protein Glove_313g37 [Diversispora epigaea]